MGFFSSRKAELDQAMADINSGDKDAIERYGKLVEHTLAEAGGSSDEAKLDALVRALKGQD
ncbi:hypothetical protein ABZ635_16780 [Nocardiopsis sp. NPDC007018]|uniref:hypothetical protein n=1 Tax=Nocardiopsis sp. NPDC007018 TaxID=3155721 RepID=UPI0033CCFD5F